MIGRETSFRYKMVPGDFKFGHSRKKKASMQLNQEQVEIVMMRLRQSIDVASFTKSRMYGRVRSLRVCTCMRARWGESPFHPGLLAGPCA